ncbi:MAG: hypothetical protein ABF893_13240, partial [Gluconacetobacter liquefaciens]
GGGGAAITAAWGLRGGAPGRGGGGGAELSPAGIEILRLYREIEGRAAQAALPALRELATLLAPR